MVDFHEKVHEIKHALSRVLFVNVKLKQVLKFLDPELKLKLYFVCV